MLGAQSSGANLDLVGGTHGGTAEGITDSRRTGRAGPDLVGREGDKAYEQERKGLGDGFVNLKRKKNL